MAVHSAAAILEVQPEYTAVETDRENMYNNSCRVATFEALHEYDPECKPVYRMLYGGEADIFVDRTRPPP